MALSDEEWRLAEALAMHERYGDEAPLQISIRLGALALLRDQAGIARWQQIAAALDELTRSNVQ